MTCVIFLHIPKAAGSTLNKILDKQYPANATFQIHGGAIERSISSFKRMSQEEKVKLQCLRGHQPFGLHEWLPQPSTYITLLRDPVERLISHYYYVMRREPHFLHDDAEGMSLEEYAGSDLSPELSNQQTRMLAGGVEELELAKRNLEHFTVAGTVERFDASVALMKERLGWGNTRYRRMNATRNRPPKRDVSPGAIRAIEENNQLDIELYELVSRRLEEEL